MSKSHCPTIGGDLMEPQDLFWMALIGFATGFIIRGLLEGQGG